VKTLLTLSATTQSSALQHAIRSFGAARPVGVVLTKIDEAALLGGALDTLINAGLPMAFYTDGQRVPEDLQPARANILVNQAVNMSEELNDKPDEHYLAMAYGGATTYANV
jgi:flagellar biosynthesis protein FlhF